jgi:hypothetical protein
MARENHEQRTDLYEGVFGETNGVDEDAHIVNPCKKCGNMPQGRNFCTTCGDPRPESGLRPEFFKPRR